MPEPTRILLVTSNGAGMGHLTRQLSVALAGGAEIEPYLFSLSIGLPQVMTLGVTGEYCPSYDRNWVPGREWHGYLRERIVAIVNELDINVLAFDGVAPYPGIGQARPRLPGVTFVWIRRGMWQSGVNLAQLKKTTFFDVIVEPGDIAAAADRGPTAGRDDAVGVGPITMLDVVPRLPRDRAARALGIEAQRPTALVTLGSGRLGAVAAPGTAALEVLLEHPDWQVCVTRPAVADKRVPVADTSRVIELSAVYPLVRYLDAFDVVVSAAGYNAVHEMIPAGKPTLFVPNAATRTDDQVARAGWLAGRGLALTAPENDVAAIAHGVAELLRPDVRQDLADAIAGLDAAALGGGAAATARLLVANAGRLVSAGQSLAIRLTNADMALREAIKRVIGPRAVDVIRRIRGTTGPEISNIRLKVEVTRDPAEAVESASVNHEPVPLLLTPDVTTEILRADRPVEHMISSSTRYRRARRKIIAKYYEVVSGEHVLL